MEEHYRSKGITDNFSYCMFQFTIKEYKILYRMTTHVTLKQKLKKAISQDKKILWVLSFSTWDEINIFYGDFNKLGLYLNTKIEVAQEILKWRLTINK
jgi:hypothetical protein